MSLLHKKGSVGQEVKRIQRVLNISDDGKFGPKTENAVKEYQSKNNLSDDGIVGPATRKSMSLDIYAGIDVSHHNGNIPWVNVDQSKVQYVWAKMSQGQDFYDRQRSRNLEGCRENGIPVGGYHFASPQLGGSDDPKKEVQCFLKALGPIMSGDMLPVLDLEAGVKGDPEHNLQWSLEWLKEFENETGLRAIIYTAKWYVNAYLKGNVGGLIDYPLWVADYTKPFKEGGRYEPDSLLGWDEWSIWQWTSKGEVQGLSRTGIRLCDRNWLSGGPNAFDKLRVCK